ncbi:unnamed protein product [Cyclocybe aegerita]|uniref:HTH CENPB-type domain-containing protein n=1 Tax=Cyclocybe aegerita TaxID=1973307 RepID=A0A8S0XSQ8_CYCAE|nr:unnamed protein product [Cyclocybe aegerita]
MPAERNTDERKRKVRTEHAPYKPRKPQKEKVKNQPKSSAQPVQKKKRDHLTLYDWLQVFAWIDDHPNVSQDKVVAHFKNCATGALVFDQSTLSQRLRNRADIEARSKSFANALSTKRVRVVTRPDVERALFLWVKHMEAKRETVTGAMLVAKRGKYEKEFNVPEDERLSGDGWVPGFKKAHNIKEYRRHGEAGSVDLEAVARERMQAILGKFAPRDRFNFDETSFFAFASPDRGLATEAMSGKKKDKFRITIGVACNADGSEKLPLLFIGRYAKPRCFGSHPPREHGFDYHHNRKAWMTMVIFDEWLRKLDIKFGKEKRRICLTVDNFSAHYIDYEPRNIRLEFFEPNLTSYVQPCDAGIIRTIKALYRKAFCLRAVELDEADEPDIYKINLLKAMLMVQQAWDAVDAKTISNCWRHAKIQPTDALTTAVVQANPAAVTASIPATKDMAAWDVVLLFATSDEMRLLQAEEKLRDVLGVRYVEEEWQPVLKVVMDAENNQQKAVKGIDQVSQTHLGFEISKHRPDNIGSSSTPTKGRPPLPQLQSAEEDLMKVVQDLKARRRIIGAPLTLEEMLNPVGGDEIGEREFHFEDDDEIMARVRHEQAVARGEVIELDSEDEEDDDHPRLSTREIMDLCTQLERACISENDPETSLDFLHGLRRFRIHLRRREAMGAKQTTLTNWFKPN